MNNGRFKKGNKAAAVKKAGKRSSFKVLANAHRVGIPEERKITQRDVKDYIPFGMNNDFPQRTAELHRKSPVSRAVIASKSDYITGVGYETSNNDFLNWNPNTKEGLLDLVSKGATDKLQDGNMYLEIVRSRRLGLLNMFHVDSTTVRYSSSRDAVILHPDWVNYESKKEFSKVYPVYPEFKLIDGFERSILHIKDYEREFSLYGVPSNLGGNDSANINYKTNKWNLSRLENGFHTSGLLIIGADFSDEDKKKFDDQFESKFVGEGRQGQLMKIINPPGQDVDQTKYEPITTNEDGNWLELHKNAKEELIIANQWYATLAGVNVSSGFDVDRIKQDYQIAINGIVTKEQNSILRPIKRMLNDQLNWDLEDLEVIQKSPISLIEQGSVDTAIISYNLEISEGRMSKEQAKASMKISYQLTDGQVNSIWP